MSNSFLPPLPTPPVSPDELLAYLQAANATTKTIQHPALFTVEESKKIKLDGGHTKNLFMKDKNSNYFLLTAEQNATVDLKNLHKHIGGKGRLSFAKPDALMELLGVLPGSVSALGLINDQQNKVKFILDKKLTTFTSINCHPLTNTATTNIKYDDFIRFVNSTNHDIQIIDLTKGFENE